MVTKLRDIIDVANDWSLDANELRAAVGRAILAIDDATNSLEAQNDSDLQKNLEGVAVELFELVEDQEDN